LGCYISFAGNITFKKATELQEAAALTRPERLLIETDAPYLTPVPYRGKGNEPAMVRHTFAYVADLLGYEQEKLATTLWRNSHEAFGLA
jgi:TatD DNase family protein